MIIIELDKLSGEVRIHECLEDFLALNDGEHWLLRLQPKGYAKELYWTGTCKYSELMDENLQPITLKEVPVFIR